VPGPAGLEHRSVGATADIALDAPGAHQVPRPERVGTGRTCHRVPRHARGRFAPPEVTNLPNE
jgi:hypothetical protein